MRRGGTVALIAATLGVMFSEAGATAMPLTTLECGEEVTTSIKLGNDLLNCPEGGIVVGASNITIDLNGHRITGPATPEGWVGVYDSGFDHVTLRSNRAAGPAHIEGFQEGAWFENASAATVHGIDTAGQYQNGVGLVRTSGASVSGSALTSANRGVFLEESSDAVVQGVRVSEIEHSGVALFDDTGSTVRRTNVDTNGGDWSIEVVNSSNTLVEHNRIRGFGPTAIGVVGEKGRPIVPGEVARANRIEANSIREGVNAEAGIEVVEVDGGTVRETTVANNAISGAAYGGIFVEDVISEDGQGDPPYEYPVGVGPSQNLLEGNLVNGNGITENGIFLTAPGNTVTSNRADRNAEWGIYAIEGTTDGGGNTAHRNGQPGQCSGVVCNGVTAASPMQRTTRLAVPRFRAVVGDQLPTRRGRQRP